MDLLSELPAWGQWTVFGISVSLNIWNYIQHVRGETVPRKHSDQIQKTAESWQKAWETSMQVQASTTLVLERVNTLADTLEHVLTSLPAPTQGDDKK